MSDKYFTTSFAVAAKPETAFAAINDVRAWWSGEIDGATDRTRRRIQFPLQGHAEQHPEDYGVRPKS